MHVAQDLIRLPLHNKGPKEGQRAVPHPQVPPGPPLVQSACRQPASKGLSETGSKLPFWNLSHSSRAPLLHQTTHHPFVQNRMTSRHPGFCPGLKGPSPVVPAAPPGAPLPSPLTLVSEGCTVTEPHSKGQGSSSLHLSFSMLPQFQE